MIAVSRMNFTTGLIYKVMNWSGLNGEHSTPVKNYLLQFFNNKEHLVTSQLEQDVINQAHWNIYYGS